MANVAEFLKAPADKYANDVRIIIKYLIFLWNDSLAIGQLKDLYS